MIVINNGYKKSFTPLRANMTNAGVGAGGGRGGYKAAGGARAPRGARRP